MMCSRVIPAMEMRLVRLFSPATILTAATCTFKRSASKRRNASFARFSSAGAVSRTFSASPYAPSIAFRLARGITRTIIVIAPLRSTISIPLSPLARRTTRCRSGFLSRLLRWRFRSRGSCPSKAQAAVRSNGGLNRREARATWKNMAALASDHPKKAAWSSIPAIPDGPDRRRFPLRLAHPTLALHFWSPRHPTSPRLELANGCAAQRYSTLHSWRRVPLRRQRQAFALARSCPRNPRGQKDWRPGALCCLANGRSNAMWHEDPQRAVALSPILGLDFRQSDAGPHRKRCESHRREKFLTPRQSSHLPRDAPRVPLLA